MYQLFLELRPFFTFKRCFPSNFFLKRLICVLDSYYIHRFIIIKYGQVRFRVKSANYYKSYGPFFNFIFLQNACVWVRMALDGGICVILIHFYFLVRNEQGPVFQSFVSLTSLLMTNSLTVVAKIFSDTLICLLQKCE